MLSPGLSRMVTTLLLVAVVSTLANASPAPEPQSGGLGGLIGSIGMSFVTSGNAVPNGPAPKGCSDYEILVARGTGEPGSFGLIVGDQLVSGVGRQVRGSRGYAVQYPANMNMTGSAPVGVADTIKRLNNQHKNCPKQKFAIVGYSQGAGVMHSVFANAPVAGGSTAAKPTLEKDVLDKIVAVVMFGDPGFRVSSSGPGGGGFGGIMPKFPPPLDTRLKQNCAAGDPVCDPNGGGFENHLKYAGNPFQSESQTFIAAAFKGQRLPSAITSSADPRWKGAPAKAGGGGGGKSGGGGKGGGGPPKGAGGSKGGGGPPKGAGGSGKGSAPKGAGGPPKAPPAPAPPALAPPSPPPASDS